MTVLIFVAGLVLLVIGADLLVRGASRLALSLGISPLVVGLTVVAFGTSAPELAVSIDAVTTGSTDLAIGNVVGSNIFNVLFILGISAILAPLVVAHQIVRQEVPIMIGASVLLFLMALDGGISRIDGAVFLALFVIYTVFLIEQSRSVRGETVVDAPAAATTWDSHRAVQLLLIVVGLVLLVWGADLLVNSAIIFAKALGVSELVIGLTIVAAGTSMPEVATSVMASIRGQRDIAVGNVIGSCTFNILCVLGVSSVVAPSSLPVAPSLLAFDLPVMLAVAVACLPMFLRAGTINRWEGMVFLGYYGAYTAYLILAAGEHDALAPFRAVMWSVVLPLTIVTIAVMLYQGWRRRSLAGS